MKFIIKYKIIF